MLAAAALVRAMIIAVKSVRRQVRKPIVVVDIRIARREPDVRKHS